jgi:fibro-slime domain-containing protein
MVSARLWVPVCLLVLTHCSAGKDDNSGGSETHQAGKATTAGTSSQGTGGTPNNTAGSGFMLGGNGNSAGTATSGSGGSGVDMSGCGDGVIQAAALDEVCDDGNSVSGDGCSADCKVVEENFSCLKPGKPCESTVVCGDGEIGGMETCDDGNAKAKDGCDATCQLEKGWLCPSPGDLCIAEKCGDGIIAGVEQCEDDDAVPTSGDGCSATCTVESGFVCEMSGKACRKAVCGDGVVEGGEPCDDKNTVVGDGCSPGCEAEPICTKPTAANGCTSSCGDGILLDGDPNEDCDDGNKRDGDGCSSKCKVEAGYKCDKEAGALPPSISIPFVFRDFIAFPSMTTTLKRHPDFQARCVGQQALGMLNPTLDAEGKPTNSNSCNLLANCTLTQGYTNPATATNCEDHESCPADFDTCDQLHGLHPIAGHPGDPLSFWYRTTDGVNKEKVVPTTLTLTNGSYQFNSNALFPLDNDGFVASGDELKRGSHNFGFTSEVRRWFTFGGGELLTFNGDDDVWVFINGKMALDIGGVHAVEVRTIRLNANGTVDCKDGEPGAGTFDVLTDCKKPATPLPALGLARGQVYEIALFHAERHSDASNFRLALTGFVSAKSKCAPVCGDGTQTPGEACDDGKNNDDTKYGSCSTTCKRGPHCGDAMLQTPDEECDDGKNLTPYSPTKKGCAPGCKLPSYCGDGKLDGLFGEECDDGKNTGGYAGCDPDCTLGPRCGDGKVDDPDENCDDGNAVGGDGCSAKCIKEMPK